VNVLFSVKDDGKSLTNAECESLFAPFSKLKPGNAKSSDTVSLSAAKQILEVHGAKVAFQSAEGGSTFSFQLELDTPNKAEACDGGALLATEIVNTSAPHSAKPSQSFASSMAFDNMRKVSKVQNIAPPSSASVKRIELSSPKKINSNIVSPRNENMSSEVVIAAAVNSADQNGTMVDQDKGAAVQPPITEVSEIVHLISEEGKIATVGGDSSMPRALLVDDVRSNRRIYGRLLEMIGYAVTTANDGLEAMDEISRATEPFLVIFIDHSMVR
jgi:Histidine kinase-, DNA gyrase B-, and HSP90-like ATPase